MEKPFTETAAETGALLRLASEKQLRITVGHNLQFSPEALRMRELVKSGFLGGPPIHMETVQCYSHDEPTYGRIVLADPLFAVSLQLLGISQRHEQLILQVLPAHVIGGAASDRIWRTFSRASW